MKEFVACLDDCHCRGNTGTPPATREFPGNHLHVTGTPATAGVAGRLWGGCLQYTSSKLLELVLCSTNDVLDFEHVEPTPRFDVTAMQVVPGLPVRLHKLAGG